MWPRSILRTAYTGYHFCEILISTYSAVVHSVHRVHGEKTKSKSSTTTMITLSVILPSVLPFHTHCRLLGLINRSNSYVVADSYLSVLRVNERKSKRTRKKVVRDKKSDYVLLGDTCLRSRIYQILRSTICSRSIRT